MKRPRWRRDCRRGNLLSHCSPEIICRINYPSPISLRMVEIECKCSRKTGRSPRRARSTRKTLRKEMSLFLKCQRQSDSHCSRWEVDRLIIIRIPMIPNNETICILFPDRKLRVEKNRTKQCEFCRRQEGLKR